MKDFRGGLRQKFIELYKAYADEIYQYVYLRTGFDRTVAEDITQNIFMDVMKGMSGFKGFCSERTWLFRIAKNKLNDFYRKQYSCKFKLVDIDGCSMEQAQSMDEDIDEGILKDAAGREVRECLSSMLEQQRIVLILKYVDEKSTKEIAEILGKSPKAVESMLQRAKISFIKKYKLYREREKLQ